MLKLSYSTNGLTKLSFFDAIREVEKAGFDGVELSFQDDQFNPHTLTETDLLHIKSFFEKISVKPVAISTATTFFLSEVAHEPSMLCLDESSRKKRISLIKKGIEIAKKIGVPIVSFQSGYLREEHIDNPSINPRKLLCEAIQECLENVGDILLVIEPEPGMYIETNQDAITLIDEINSPNFRLHLDIGHAYCTEENYVESIGAALPYIEYMHLADIKEGYNLKFLSINSLLHRPHFDFDYAGYFIYVAEKNYFMFLDKLHCVIFCFQQFSPQEKDDIHHFLDSINCQRLVNFILINHIEKLQYSIEQQIEIKAYLDSVAGINLDVIQKSLPLLSYMRYQPFDNNTSLITKPICNTLKGKVHYHEFPGKGKIDFHSIFKVLENKHYKGYITVELYNHVDVWQTVLPESRNYLMQFMNTKGN